MRPIPVVIDCDPGHDDAIALMLAAASPEIDLLGVTTVAGNTTVDKTTRNTLAVLGFAGCGGYDAMEPAPAQEEGWASQKCTLSGAAGFTGLASR